jgi:hypothetical protein
MPETTDVCAIENCNKSGRQFDFSGRLFCSLQHYQEYWQKYGIPNFPSHEQISAQNLLKLNETNNAFVQAIDISTPEGRINARKTVEQRILQCREMIEAFRATLEHHRKFLIQVQEKQEAYEVERARATGTNTESDAVEKGFGIVRRNIVSWRKMNMTDEMILTRLKMITSFSEERLKEEMEKLK